MDQTRHAKPAGRAHQALAVDPLRLPAFGVVQAADPAELDAHSRVSERFPAQSRMYKYRLRDPALWRTTFEAPVFGLAIRSAGAIVASHGENRFATDIDVEGDPDGYYAFAMMRRGRMTVIRDGEDATGQAGRGLAYRTVAGTRFVSGDDCLRSSVFLKVGEVTAALENLIDARLRKPLEFRPEIDWTHGLAASLKRQFDVVLEEFARPDGLAGNAVALASTTDLLARLALVALPHSHTDLMEAGRAGAVPAYLRRAEEFMHAHCAEPIRMAQVADAAGCSLRTLDAVFRQFRGTTPLGALHGIRLDQVHRELSLAGTDAPVAAIARRHGFTNASRFAAAFRRRFGETPAEVLRRARRS